MSTHSRNNNGLSIATLALRRVLVGALPLTVSSVLAQDRQHSPSTSRPSAERERTMKIEIRIGGKILTATVAENATARGFVALLPLSLTMNDLFGREKYGDLPKALSEEGPGKNRFDVGDIAYWSPNQQFAVFYRQDGQTIPSPGVIPIARLDSGVEAFNVPGSVKVTVALARQ